MSDYSIKSYINLPYSVSSYFNVSFIHRTILDSLPAFQVINKKETYIINKLFSFKKYVIKSMPNIWYILYL